MWRSWHEGRAVAVPVGRTLADGLAVHSPRESVLRLLRRWLDDVVTVEEDELAGAMVLLLERAKLVAEGAGAVAVAALVYGRVALIKGLRTVAVLSGGNVDLNTLVRVVDRGLMKTGRLLRLRTRLVDRPGSLRRLLDVVAAQGANVVTVEHDRLAPEVPVGEAEVTLLVETRDAEHAAVLLDDLQRRGFETGGTSLDA